MPEPQRGEAVLVVKVTGTFALGCGKLRFKSLHTVCILRGAVRTGENALAKPFSRAISLK